jgi:hypothetical protein
MENSMPMSTKTRLLAAVVTPAAIRAIALSATLPASAAPTPTATAAPAASAVSVPVTGTAVDNTFAGTLAITRFVSRNGQLLAVGTLTGTLTNTVTGATQAVTQAVTVPVAAATGSCQVLDLTLGPLNLNLLGLVVTLNQVHLNITAQQGPGNLLGNLLCAVANLLNGGGPLTALAGLLNQILAAL